MAAAEQMQKEGDPSEETEHYWIWADNESSVNNQTPDDKCGKSGKWLLFEDLHDIDDAWEQIKAATMAGRLGFRSKVSTMKDKEPENSEFVICVYTYDWTNQTDVDRVRVELLKMGFRKKLPYKADEDTRAGNYAEKGKRISKYYY